MNPVPYDLGYKKPTIALEDYNILSTLADSIDPAQGKIQLQNLLNNVKVKPRSPPGVYVSDEEDEAATSKPGKGRPLDNPLWDHVFWSELIGRNEYPGYRTVFCLYCVDKKIELANRHVAGDNSPECATESSQPECTGKKHKKELENRRIQACQLYTDEIKGLRPLEMVRTHLKKCKSAPPEVKTELKEEIAKIRKSKTKTPKTASESSSHKNHKNKHKGNYQTNWG